MKKLNFMSQVKLIGAIACLGFLAGVAHATPVIYNNLGSASDGVDPVAGWTLDGWVNSPPLFNSFLVGPVGPEGTTLLDVQLMLKSSSSSASSSRSFTVSLFSDSNTSPGTIIGLPIGTLSDSSLTSDLSVVDFPTARHLDANTRYWIELSSSNGSTAEWSWSYDQNALGVAGEYCGHDAYIPGHPTKDWVYSTNSYGAYQMQVVIPLPGAVWLLGSGLAGLGLWRGRKLFKA